MSQPEIKSETKQLLAQSYEIAYYEDPKSCSGYHKQTEYFIGEPYYMIVNIDPDRKENGVNIFASKEPCNTYRISYDSSETTSSVTEVMLDKSWIDECKEILDAELSAKKKKQNVYKTRPLPINDVSLDNLWSSGTYNLIKANYQDAISDFTKYLEMKPDNTGSVYNIACAHALLKDKVKAFEWLNKAIECGYTDWQYTLDDDDFKELREEKEFKECISKMKNKETQMKNKETTTKSDAKNELRQSLYNTVNKIVDKYMKE